MDLNPRDFAPGNLYKLCIGAVLPRPIAWVSTMDAAGNLNVAPFSYFTIAAVDPLTLIFCPQIRARQWPAQGYAQQHPRRAGIRGQPPQRGDGRGHEPDRDHAAAGSVRVPRGPASHRRPAPPVRVPRVAEAPIAFECTLQQIVAVNDGPGGGVAVFGAVQAIYVRDDIYDQARGYILLERYQPIGRLAGDGYVRVTDTFDLARIPAPGASADSTRGA